MNLIWTIIIVLLGALGLNFGEDERSDEVCSGDIVGCGEDSGDDTSSADDASGGYDDSVGDRFIVEGEYDNGEFQVGDTVNVLGQNRDLRMLFTLDDIYKMNNDGDMKVIAEFTIENTNDVDIVPSEDFPMFFTVPPHVVDYAETDIDYTAPLAPDEVVSGQAVLVYDPTWEDARIATLGFNMFPFGEIPDPDLLQPSVLEAGDIRFTEELVFLEVRE